LALMLLASPAASASGSAAVAAHDRLPAGVHPTGDDAADALYLAATRTEHARTQAPDMKAAVRLYCRAAKRGHPAAAYRLGWLFLHGTGVPADDGQAAAWLEFAAAQGSRAARGLRGLIPSATPDARRTCGAPMGLAAHPRAIGPVDAPAGIRAIVEPLAKRHAVDPELVLSVIAVESAFDADAVSPKNAQGLMQLIPATAERFGVGDPFDPRQNVAGGIKYLAWLSRRFDGELDHVLAAYNAGEGKVERYGGIPPYPETQNYVRKVRKLYGLPATDVYAEAGATR
jgi:soluble lytic murein transglycosylase-like protein